MTDFPPVRALAPFGGGGVISTGTVLASLNATNMTTVAWPAANLAIFVPFRVPEPVTVYKMAIGAGASATGNFDVGLYDAAGNRLLHSGATAKGNSVEHIIDVTDTDLGPGLYYLALAADGTNNYVGFTPSGTSPVPLQKIRAYGIVEMATAYTLPDPATFAAAATTTIVPAIAAYLRPY